MDTVRGLPAEGFEPPTYGLQNRCTTTVLSRQIDKLRCTAGSGAHSTAAGLLGFYLWIIERSDDPPEVKSDGEQRSAPAVRALALIASHSVSASHRLRRWQLD
jgi:hypothetical protein